MSVDERIRRELSGYADGLDMDPYRALDFVRVKSARRRRNRAAAAAAGVALAVLVVAGLSTLGGNLFADDSHQVIGPPAPSPSTPTLSPRVIGIWGASTANLVSAVPPGDRQSLSARQMASLNAELPHRGRLILTISGDGSWQLVATNFYGSSTVLEQGWYDVEVIPGQVTLHDGHTGATTVVYLFALKGYQPTRLSVSVVSATPSARGLQWVLVQEARFGGDFRLIKHTTP